MCIGWVHQLEKSQAILIKEYQFKPASFLLGKLELLIIALYADTGE